MLAGYLHPILVSGELDIAHLYKLQEMSGIPDSEVQQVGALKDVGRRESEEAQAMVERSENDGLGRVRDERCAVEQPLVATIKGPYIGRWLEPGGHLDSAYASFPDT